MIREQKTEDRRLNQKTEDTREKTATGGEIVTVRPGAEVMSPQRLPYFVGISEQTAGTRALSMYLVAIPPGAVAAPHYHDGYETAIYLLRGRVETRYGERLEKSVVNEPGDFVFIPPNLPHEARNVGDETAYGIVARNDPNENENVVPYTVPSPSAAPR